MPLPCTMRNRIAPERNARSMNFSTALVASSTFCPMTLISVGTLSSSRPATRQCHASARGRDRIGAGADHHAGYVVARDLHLHRTRPPFRKNHRPGGAAPWRYCPASSNEPCRRPTRCTTWGCASRSPVSEPVVCATTVESNCSRNSRAHLGDAPLGILRQLQRLRAVLNRVDRLARADIRSHAARSPASSPSREFSRAALSCLPAPAGCARCASSCSFYAGCTAPCRFRASPSAVDRESGTHPGSGR